MQSKENEGKRKDRGLAVRGTLFGKGMEFERNGSLTQLVNSSKLCGVSRARGKMRHTGKLWLQNRKKE
ncbi:hypothetical protein T09_2127 [Trichinella sp. T9]|nr:hypothetical protein T09_2127 [Trichinella sp. T9]